MSQIRIIGGRFRGKKMVVPEVEGLRPTPNRIRETLFNWLMHEIQGAHCLDAFAGTGALGLEAFSRGAAQVVFLEEAPKATRCLKQLLDSFKATELNLVQTDARLYLQQSKSQFDLIFLDPPFSQNYLPTCLEAIRVHQRLRPRGLVYFESAAPLELDEKIWKFKKSKQAGSVFYGLIEQVL